MINRGLPGYYSVTCAASYQQSIDAAKLMVEERFGKLDVLVNNAAILYDEWQRAENANLSYVRPRTGDGRGSARQSPPSHLSAW